MAFELPKEFFNHAVVYTEVGRTDRWGDPIDSEPIEVRNVKVEPVLSTNVSIQEVQDASKAVVYINPRYSTYIDFKEESKVEWEGQNFVIKRIHHYSQPLSEGIHHIKLELV